MSGFVERFPFLVRTLSDLEQPLTQIIPHGPRGSCLVRLGCGFSIFLKKGNQLSPESYYCDR